MTRPTAHPRLIAPLARLPAGAWLMLSMAAIAVWKLHFAVHLAGLEPYWWPIVVNGGAFLALYAWVACLGSGGQVFAYAGLAFVGSFIAHGDVIFFRQCGDLLSVAKLHFAGQMGSVSEAIVSLMRPADVWLWIDVPILIAVGLYLNRRPIQWMSISARRILPLSLVGVSVVGAFVTLDPGMDRVYHGHTMMARRAGLFAYHALDAGLYVARRARAWLPGDAALQETRERLRSRPSAPSGPDFGLARGRNLIVLQIESLQTFAIGLAVDGREVTPHLNRLRAESLYFDELYTQVGQGMTADADLLVNCSLYPTPTGAVYSEYAHNEFHCLPSILREAGYRSHAFQGIRPDYWNYAAMYPRVGFERFHSLGDYEHPAEMYLGVLDAPFLRQTLPKLRALPEPFHAFVVTLSSHTPFEFHGMPKVFDAGPHEGTDLGRYLNAVHYTDAAVGSFVDALRAEGILDESVLAIYGDHMGLWHGATGFRELFADVPQSDEAAWWRIVRRVPLFVRVPGGARTGVRSEVAGLVDVAPTLAGLLGVDRRGAPLLGRDLLATSAGVVAFPDGSALDDTQLFVADGPRCLRWAGGPGDCAALAARAAADLRLSALLVEHDLVPRLVEGTTASARR